MKILNKFLKDQRGSVSGFDAMLLAIAMLSLALLASHIYDGSTTSTVETTLIEYKIASSSAVYGSETEGVSMGLYVKKFSADTTPVKMYETEIVINEYPLETKTLSFPESLTTKRIVEDNFKVVIEKEVTHYKDNHKSWDEENILSYTMYLPESAVFTDYTTK